MPETAGDWTPDSLTPSKFHRSIDATPLRVNTSVPATGVGRGSHEGDHQEEAHKTSDDRPQRALLRETYYLGIKIRYVNISQRSAFRWPPLPSEDEVVSKGTNTSPSLDHIRILRGIHSHQVIRQIHFSPGLGANADVKFPEGRSRFPAIEPPSLPSPAPRYKRHHRLPNRADVGFPNPTAEEIRLKQEEIRHETLWEEFSPRLIAHFPRYDFDELWPKANPASMLAPPLGATYSPSQGWRPRAIHDRSPERQYCLACCLTSFERASLTLFTLPPLYRDKHALNAASAAAYHCRHRNIKPAYGKMSEEFWVRPGPSCGVFSFDPSELFMESNKKNAILHHSVYLVLRVYNGERELQYFGVTKFFRDHEGMEWPKAMLKDICLHAFQGSDSKDSFLERLWSIVHQRYVTDDAVSVDDISVNSKRSSGTTVKRSRTPPPSHGSRKRLQTENKQARLVLSSLGTDFLRCLLHECEVLRMPPSRLLVDVSGKEGIRLEHVGERPMKRSDLQRIPVDGEIGQFTEVCYLPPQSEKNHNIDCLFPGSRGVVNLLFLYPRRIRCIKRESHFEPGAFYSIRIKCLKADEEIDSFQVPGQSGQSPSYTTKLLRAVDASRDLTFYEEVKLHLPKVFDGSSLLQFALFTGDLLLAEASMPLSTSQDGERARIVLPNGKHRLQLQDFQFQVDTRVVSSLHVANQDVADAFCESNQANPKLSPARMITLAPGCGSSAVAHFQPLLHKLLSSLYSMPPESNSIKVFEQLFTILKHTREYFGSRNNGVSSLSHFLKCHVDMFDDRTLTSSTHPNETPNDVEDAEENNFWEFKHQEFEETSDQDEVSVLSLSQSARRQHKFRNPFRSKHSAQGTPFARLPYGASKIDRMKAEAELHEDDNQFASFFEDDETIATAPSFYSEKKLPGSKRIYIDRITNSKISRKAEKNDIENDGSFGPGANLYLDERLRSIGGAAFAKKVRTAASAVLAPCVGPTLPSFLRQSGPTTPHKNISHTSRTFFESVSASIISLLAAAKLAGRQKSACFCPPESVAGDDVTTNKPLNEKLWNESLRLHENSRQRVSTITASDPINGLFQPLLFFFCSRWNPEDIEGALRDTSLRGFLENLDILLAVALKSIILVHADANDTRKPQHPEITLSPKHFDLVADFTENVAESLIRQVSSGGDDFETLLDFVVGIVGALVRVQARDYCVRFFGSLRRKTATTSIQSRYLQARFQSSRRFLSLPCFVELNETPKINEYQPTQQSSEVSWLLQSQQSRNTNDLTPPSTSDSSTQGWLSNLVLRDSLETCITATQIIMKEAIQTVQHNGTVPKNGSPEQKDENQDGLKLLNSSAIGGIAMVHEVLFRRHAMDARYQSDGAKGRISSIFLPPMLEKSLEYADVLSDLPIDHVVRRLWMGCLLHVLQDAPEMLISNYVARLSLDPMRARRLVSILHAAAKSFETEFHSSSSSTGPTNETSWVRQECFNIICAAINIVVEICLSNATVPWNDLALGKDIGACFLFILSIDQSAVTFLRAIGGAMVIVEANVDFFVQSNQTNLESWIRILVVSMNSISLSVRSVAVDFTLSLLSGLFQNTGNVDSLLLMFSTILPTVVTHEIGNAPRRDSQQVVWPLRRSIADIEDSTPEDDPRIDSQLMPTLKLFCRTCQALIDGVLIELQLASYLGEDSEYINTHTVFAADEESLYEAASFFMAESAPLQRIRWLSALCLLQRSKSHLLEAAEALMLVAQTVCNALPLLKQVWQPELPQGRVDLLNEEAIVLEPSFLLLRQLLAKRGRPSVATMCEMLTNAVNEAVGLYIQEGGMEQLAYGRVEISLKALMKVIEEHDKRRITGNHNRATAVALRRKKAEEQMSLRRASTVLSGAMNSLAEKLLDYAKEESPSGLPISPQRLRPQYVLMHVHGLRPPDFYESTTIPVFLEWGKPCICRVPGCRSDAADDSILKFAAPFVKELQRIVGISNLIVRTTSETDHSAGATFLDIFRTEIVDPDPFHTSYASFLSKRFFYKVEGSFIETKVAQEFPCALSRQSSLLTTQITLASQ